MDIWNKIFDDLLEYVRKALKKAYLQGKKDGMDKIIEMVKKKLKVKK